MTIRDQLNLIQQECRNSELYPARASALLVELTAIFANVNTELRQRRFELAKKKLAFLQESKSVSEAKLKSDASEEWLLAEEALNASRFCQELVRSLKVFIRAQSEEIKQSGNL